MRWHKDKNDTYYSADGQFIIYPQTVWKVGITEEGLPDPKIIHTLGTLENAKTWAEEFAKAIQ